MKTLEELIQDNDWLEISCYQYLTENFIEKHYDKVNWSYISECQKLSEKFIEKYSDKVNWYCISKYQKLSEEFIIKNKDRFDKNYLSHNIIFDEKINRNICFICNTKYLLNIKSCNELIMNRALK